ncbi:Zn-dependent exopeptidase [Xylona heveae TC161]|uniref:Zn-dependent exopeptidase n=1 Tax=Xylona heveae (strain CBS 132557 / TC161) TaxID=1328760 RepID=A0A161TQJ8_XYLHT|nr:Zn-dependent exopeptidase [Xylona heveae TC161]KZF24626.1 Zn-dependent exopeptidase [Xylona heveae TC161]
MKLQLLLALAATASCSILPKPQLTEQLPIGQKNSLEDRINASPLLSLHRDLVKIESVTGNEFDAGQFLIGYLSKHNFTVEIQQVTPADNLEAQDGEDVISTFRKERFNVLAYPGKTRKTKVLVSSHYDTVPGNYPYETRGEDEIWGRGSVDDKASVAAQITAVKDLLASKEVGDGDVGLLFVVGEEKGGDGMRHANELGLSWDAVIFGEPTEHKLVAGHKGMCGFTLTAKGKSGHSGYPELSINANSLIIPALAALNVLEMPSSEKFGNSTINIGRIAGGVAANVVPDHAEANVAIRIAAGNAEEMRSLVLKTVHEAGGKDLNVRFESQGYAPVNCDTDIDGFDTLTVNYGTDVPYLLGNHKRYLYGPGSIFVAHSDHEHLRIGDLERAVKDYKTLVREALKNARASDATAVEYIPDGSINV